MKSLLACCLLLFLMACQPPWVAPNAVIQTRADHKQDLYELIKRVHDRAHPTDKMNLVYRAVVIKRQGNGLGSFESWTVGTEHGNKVEYIIQTAYYINNRYSGVVGYMVVGEASPKLIKSLDLLY